MSLCSRDKVVTDALRSWGTWLRLLWSLLITKAWRPTIRWLYSKQNGHKEDKHPHYHHFLALMSHVHNMVWKTSDVRGTKSQSLKVSCLILQLSLPNPYKPGVELGMKMYLEQCRQPILQLQLSDQEFYCQLRGDLYKRFDCTNNSSQFIANHNDHLSGWFSVWICGFLVNSVTAFINDICLQGVVIWWDTCILLCDG